MAIYDPELLEEIRENVDFVEYIESTGMIELQKRRNDYYGSCPLHEDITPSFSVNPDENFFYCFSCHRGGDIFAFMQEYEDLTFDEAVEKGMALAGIDGKKLCKSDSMVWLKRLRKQKKNKKGNVEHEILSESVLNSFKKQPAEEWIEEGIPSNVQKFFEIQIDEKSDRIIYPVRDELGHLINVKGRTRKPDYKIRGINKYINYYPVEELDYLQSLDKLKNKILAKGEVIVFESIKSTMKAFSWGYKNSVSAESHNLKKEQIRKLIKMGVDVVLAYDSDVDYWEPDIRKQIETLKQFTNVYIIEDRNKLLGGAEAKNAPVDKGREVWEKLYEEKRKIR